MHQTRPHEEILEAQPKIKKLKVNGQKSLAKTTGIGVKHKEEH